MTGGLFPFDDTEEFPDLIEEESNEEYIYKDFEIDWKTMRMTGKIVEGRDAVEQWAHIALRTSRYDWLIYSLGLWGGIHRAYRLLIFSGVS